MTGEEGRFAIENVGMTGGKAEGFVGLCRFEESCCFGKEPSELEAFDDGG
jgi:hypothetical protein